MKTIEVPWPSLSAGCFLVRNHYSLISAGTEDSTVKTARKGLIGKAKERPQQVKQVLDVLKNSGAGTDLPGCYEKARCLFSPWRYCPTGRSPGGSASWGNLCNYWPWFTWSELIISYVSRSGSTPKPDEEVAHCKSNNIPRQIKRAQCSRSTLELKKLCEAGKAKKG